MSSVLSAVLDEDMRFHLITHTGPKSHVLIQNRAEYIIPSSCIELIFPVRDLGNALSKRSPLGCQVQSVTELTILQASQHEVVLLPA